MQARRPPVRLPRRCARCLVPVSAPLPAICIVCVVLALSLVEERVLCRALLSLHGAATAELNNPL